MKKTKKAYTIIGIDPGKKGAIAVISCPDQGVEWSKIIAIYDMPIIGKQVDGIELSRIIGKHCKTRLAILEKVGVRPGNGAVSMFNFGHNAGMIEGVLNAHGIPIHKPTPPVWKAVMGISGDKKEALAKAKFWFPNSVDLFARVKDADRAEAALLGVFGARVYRTYIRG